MKWIAELVGGPRDGEVRELDTLMGEIQFAEPPTTAFLPLRTIRYQLESKDLSIDEKRALELGIKGRVRYLYES